MPRLPSVFVSSPLPPVSPKNRLKLLISVVPAGEVAAASVALDGSLVELWTKIDDSTVSTPSKPVAAPPPSPAELLSKTELRMVAKPAGTHAPPPLPDARLPCRIVRRTRVAPNVVAMWRPAPSIAEFPEKTLFSMLARPLKLDE